MCDTGSSFWYTFCVEEAFNDYVNQDCTCSCTFSAMMNYQHKSVNPMIAVQFDSLYMSSEHLRNVMIIRKRRAVNCVINCCNCIIGSIFIGFLNALGYWR